MKKSRSRPARGRARNADFQSALHQYVHQLTAGTRLSVEVMATPRQDLSPAHRKALYRLAREALSGTSEHGRGRCLRIVAGRLRDSVFLVVVEDLRERDGRCRSRPAS
jgi:signal transduction histidine kinase